MTTTTATHDRPLITRSRAELERAVIEAARAVGVPGRYFTEGYRDRFAALNVALADLDEWERLRAEAAGK